MPVWTSFFIAFGALLPLINPLGSALVFTGLVGEAPSSAYRSLARGIAINNVVFLGVFELLGATILNFFGLSLPTVQLAGGIVIAAMGWSVLNERDAAASSRNKKEETEVRDESHLLDLEHKVFYPFTFPITSGPGTLVALLTLTARISEPTVARNVLSHLGIFLAIVIISLMVYFSYAYSPKITSKVPPSTAHGILRVVAFILMCIGVQIAWNGLSVLLKDVIHP